MDGVQKTEQEKMDLLQTMHDDELKISQEGVAAIKDLTTQLRLLLTRCNIHCCTDKFMGRLSVICAFMVDSIKVRAESSRYKSGVIVAEGIQCLPDKAR